MNIMFSRGKFWLLVLLLLVIGFVYYTRKNPDWKEPIKRTAQDYYLLPKD